MALAMVFAREINQRRFAVLSEKSVSPISLLADGGRDAGFSRNRQEIGVSSFIAN
jgi:hypothetical protein